MGSLKGCWGRRPQEIFCGPTAIGPPSRRNQADRRFSTEGRSGWRAERQKDSRAQSDSNSGSRPADDGRMTLDWLAGWLDGWDRIRETGTVCGLCMQERIGATWRLLQISYSIQLKCYCCYCHWYSADAGDDISGRATQLWYWFRRNMGTVIHQQSRIHGVFILQPAVTKTRNFPFTTLISFVYLLLALPLIPEQFIGRQQNRLRKK
ncbi:uncharacterized protein IWZ02DRAFT_63336 [Phyllosticta citriasiana]|uniref:uncharacterized protein n=1 Tax=Phyllosticta citriasiana TaxID=595635 RepID=UPI0030FD757B